MYIAIKVVIKNGNCKRPWHINPLRLKDFPLFLLEPRRILSFPLLFLITAELVCERYAQLAETRVMVGYILRLEAAPWSSRIISAVRVMYRTFPI